MKIMCSVCGSNVENNVQECPFCGRLIVSELDNATEQEQSASSSTVHEHPAPPPPPPSVTEQSTPNLSGTTSNTSNRSVNKTTAGILAILLGGIGIHKFYLGDTKWGIIYLVLCWTYIPIIVGIVEGVLYLTSTDEVFIQKHVKK